MLRPHLWQEESPVWGVLLESGAKSMSDDGADAGICGAGRTGGKDAHGLCQAVPRHHWI